MVKPMKKKAIFYMLMSVTIMGIIVSSMLVFSSRFKKLESSSIEVTGNEFVGSTITDISKSGLDKFMEVAAKRALFELAGLKALGTEIGDPSLAFDSLVMNGTVNGTLYYIVPTLGKYLGLTTNYYFVLGFGMEKVSINTTLTQTDPWNVLVSSKISYKVNVPRSKFTGVIEETKDFEVDIFGLPDPDKGFKITKDWNENSTYPSFLDMLEGSGGGSAYGICRDC